MFKNNFKKLKSAVISGILAITAVAAPMSTALTPTLTAQAAASDNYAKLLQYSLYFYDANMCGSHVNDKGQMTWRSNCHTDDEVEGGFHDAGDHAMFGLPQGFTASVLGWSYYEFKDAYNATGQDAHFKVIIDHFCDFFKRSTKLSGTNVSNFLYQKGDGNLDHKYWGAPEKQGGGRKMFWTSNSASDIAADYAAALALNYINFGDSDDLKYAEALYDFSTKYNSIATDGPTGFYSNKSCEDEQANAAGWLYLATNNEKYKNDCASKQTKYLGWCDGWENRGLGAACVYAHITGEWGKVNNYLGSLCSGSNYLFMDKWGSARLNCSVQMSALAASKNSNADYTNWTKGQMNYILGDNPANTCFVIGFAPNSAKNPHHRAASGYNSYNEFNGEAHPQAISPNGHSLIGALVGGPTDAGGTYSDDMNDYVCNEVACDYNAGLVGAAAGLYEVYKTGTCDTSIVGVKGTVQPPTNTTPSGVTTTTTSTSRPNTQTTTTTAAVGGDIVLTPDDMAVGTEEGDDGEMNNYAEFRPQGAKSATLYYKVNSNDLNTSGAFGTWTGTWVQEDFSDLTVPSSKIVTVDYVIPANVGQTVKAMVYWPHGNGVTIQKVVLHMGGTTTTTSTTRATTVTTRTTTKTTTTTTAAAGNDIVLTPDDMAVGTEEGDDGEMNNYAEFRPQGAKSATLYYKVNSNDLNTSGAFGTWNGSWVQEDFNDLTVPSSKIVTVDYVIPANVGQTVKAMVFWPHGDGVTIQKVVLHMGGTTTTTSTTKATTTTTRTTTTTTTTTTITTRPDTDYGDVNCDGKILVDDVILVLSYVANPKTVNVTSAGMKNADVYQTGDGIQASDAASIQKFLTKIITSLPEK